MSPNSTGLPDVNLVDGLPSARHTEAVWGAHGVFGPAAIYDSVEKCLRLSKNVMQRCIDVSFKKKFVYER